MDRASTAVGKEELGGVSVHIKLVVGGDDLEPIVDDVLAEDGGSGLFVGVAEPTESGVDTGHWAAGCWGLSLFAVLVFQDQGQGLGWTHCPLLLSWLVSGKREEWEVAFPPIGLLPATEAVVGSGLGVVRVERVLVGCG